MQKSFILVPIDSSYATSYRLSIVTFALGCTVCLATMHNVTDDRRKQHCSVERSAKNECNIGVV